jgi:hypothetical protein
MAQLHPVFETVIAQRGGVSSKTAQFLVVWVLVGTVATLVISPFQRRIGGNQADDGGPGGSEKGIVGVIWFLSAIAAGVWMAN